MALYILGDSKIHYVVNKIGMKIAAVLSLFQKLQQTAISSKSDACNYSPEKDSDLPRVCLGIL